MERKSFRPEYILYRLKTLIQQNQRLIIKQKTIDCIDTAK